MAQWSLIKIFPINFVKPCNTFGKKNMLKQQIIDHYKTAYVNNNIDLGVDLDSYLDNMGLFEIHVLNVMLIAS